MYVTYDGRRDRQVRRLVRHYFGRIRVEFPGDSAVEFHPPYGVGVDLVRENGPRGESLFETRPDPGQRSTYLSRKDADWARSWPVEATGKLVKE